MTTSLNMGEDFFAVDDLDPNLSVVEGALSLLQNTYRRLCTTRGALWYDQNYGTNILAFVEDAGLSNDTKAGIIRDEILKDERAEVVNVRVMSSASGQDSYFINVKGFDGVSFDLTLMLDGTNSNVVINQELT